MSQGKDQLPGRGLMGWLGRQLGHVGKAIATEVPDPPKTVYREKTVEEQPHPTDPNLTLRRTTIDEAVVRPNPDQKP